MNKEKTIMLIAMLEDVKRLNDVIYIDLSRGILGVQPDCDFFDLIFKEFDSMVDVVAKTTGIHIGALNWFVFENKFGKESLDINGKKVNSIEEFVNIESCTND